MKDTNLQSEVSTTFFKAVFIKETGVLLDFRVRAGGFLRMVDCCCESIFKAALKLSNKLTNMTEGILSFFYSKNGGIFGLTLLSIV